jgi:hypothetical protein
MAKFYGKTGGYLIRNDLKYFSFAVGLVLLVLILIWLIAKSAPPVIVGVAALFFIFFIVVPANPFILFFRRKSNRFYRGWGGERAIKKELENLPKNFTVFQGLKIGKHKGDIDFVVLGPTGIFLLEVKSHKGEIGFNGLDLTLNGKSFNGKSPLRQVHGETWALKKYLALHTKKDFFIHSVLVFSNPRAEVHFGYNPIANIYVVDKNSLLGLFERFPKTGLLQDIQTAEQTLLRLLS